MGSDLQENKEEEREENKPFVIYKPEITNITSKLFIKLARHTCLSSR